MMEYGWYDGPDGEEISVSEGCCFMVLTAMIPILEAATDGCVSPSRLWHLVMSRGYREGDAMYLTTGVDYGPMDDYSEQFPNVFGEDPYNTDLSDLEELFTPQEIADALCERGYWVWMRPDRFPIGPSTNTSMPPLVAPVIASRSDGSRIAVLPTELLHSVVSYLPLPSIIALASLNKSLYSQILGSAGTRDVFAKAYMRLHGRWCLPHGQAELEWWNERDVDDVLGWDYLKRCYGESYSMRNRKRIWKACESINEECEYEESGKGFESQASEDKGFV